MGWRRGVAAVALVALGLGGCAQVLGLGEPGRGSGDAGAADAALEDAPGLTGDAAADAAADALVADAMPGAPMGLVFGSAPTLVAAGSRFVPAVSVVVVDQAGLRVPGATSLVTLSISSPGVLAGTLSVAAVDGVATFADLRVTTLGNFTLTAVATGLVDAVSDPFAVGGLFAPPLAFSTGAGPSDLEIADVNKDGRLDIVTQDTGTGKVSVLLASSTQARSFEAPVAFGGGGGTPRGIALGDVDGDGKLDIVEITMVMNMLFAPAEIGILTQTSASPLAFTRAVLDTQATAGNPDVVDLDGDQRQDVLYNRAESGPGGALVVHRNSMFGLGTAEGYPLSGLPSTRAVGDVSGDGLVDVYVNAGQINRFEGKPASPGQLQGAGLLGASGYPTGLSFVDVTGDGQLDFLACAHDDAQVWIFPGAGGGGLGAPGQVAGPSIPSEVAAGDLDRDGRRDLVVMAASGLSVLLADPASGTGFGAPLGVSPKVGAGPRLVDLDGDGKLDVVIATSADSKAVVFYGQ